MAKAAKKGSAKKPAKRGNSRRKPAEEQDESEHVIMKAPKEAVRRYINECIASKSRTSAIGQEKSSATKRAQEAGVDVPAAGIGARIISKAKMDGLKGRLLWENLKYYVEECMDFDKIAPPTLFKASEMRSTRSRKKEPEQTELPVDEPQQPVQETAPEPEAVIH